MTVTVAQLEKASAGYPIARSEWMVIRERDIAAEFLIGADGYHSRVREALGCNFEPHGKSETFAVFEFSGQLGIQHEGRVVFHDDSTNVIWPLGEDRGRWSFQVDADDSQALTEERLEQLIRSRAPWFESKIERLLWTAMASFDRMRTDGFGRKRIWLAGDAAHITGPVGGQSMNVGIREAHDLAERISAVIKSGADLDSLTRYPAERQEEWRCLQEMSGVTPMPNATPRVKELAPRILPCVAASGADLGQLLEQIDLRISPGVGTIQ